MIFRPSNSDCHHYRQEPLLMIKCNDVKAETIGTLIDHVIKVLIKVLLQFIKCFQC